MRERKTIKRLPPCPSYDVEATESWLEDLAQEGWLLARDGFFAGVATFEKGEPKTVRYRLEWTSKKTWMFDDDGGEPDQDTKERNADLGWEYVARRGQFYIYRSDTPEQRELLADPAVQADFIRKVEKGQRWAVFLLLCDLLLMPLVVILLSVLSVLWMGIPWILAWMAVLTWLLVVWMVYDGIHLGRLRKQLEQGEPLNHGEDWRKGRAWHYLRSILDVLAACVMVAVMVRIAWRTGPNYGPWLSTQDSPEKLPFATIEELVPGLRAPVPGDYRQASASLVPIMLEWRETAQRGEKTLVYYSVDYYELPWEWAAKQVYTELVRRDQVEITRVCGDSFWQRFRRTFAFWRNDEVIDPIFVPDLEADEAAVYLRPYYGHTVVLRQGNRVIRATLQQYSASQQEMGTVEPAQWVIPLAQSLR